MGDEADSGHSCTVETCKFNYFALKQSDPMFGYSLFGVFSEVQSMQEIVNFDDRVFTLTYAYWGPNRGTLLKTVFFLKFSSTAKTWCLTFTSTLEYAKLLLETASSNKRQLDAKQLNSTDKNTLSRDVHRKQQPSPHRIRGSRPADQPHN